MKTKKQQEAFMRNNVLRNFAALQKALRLCGDTEFETRLGRLFDAYKREQEAKKK